MCRFGGIVEPAGNGKTREEIMPEIMGTAAAVGVCSGFTGNDGKEDR